MKKHYWTWPIATYLFLGGLGGGILLMTIILDLAFGVGGALPMGVLVALACLAIGCGLLIFELGQPKLAYRVVLSNTAIIKYGAVILTIAMVFGALYYSFFLGWFPWTNMVGIRSACGVLAGIFGLFTMIYTGVLLASFKARAFWNTPALPVLFTVSALSTACAALTFCVGAWPSIVNTTLMHEATELLHAIDLVLIPLELIIILVYLLLMRGASNVTSQKVAARWLNGAFAPLFWGGMVCGGLLIPLACYLIGGFLATVVAPVLVLAGGLLLRFLIVYSDDRRAIPGEEKFYARMPKGDEAFLTAWKH